jgi:hypothetical protein
MYCIQHVLNQPVLVFIGWYATKMTGFSSDDWIYENLGYKFS